MILEGCSDFNCMVADLTDNSSLLEIQDIERLIQSSQFHFLPSVLLPTLSPPRPPICRQLSYLNFMQACIHPKGKKIIQCMHQTSKNYSIARFHFSLPICFSLHSPIWAVDRQIHALKVVSTKQLTWIKDQMSQLTLDFHSLSLQGSRIELLWCFYLKSWKGYSSS